MVEPVKIVCCLKRGCAELTAACAEFDNVTISTAAPDAEALEAELRDADVLVINNAFYTAGLLPKSRTTGRRSSAGYSSIPPATTTPRPSDCRPASR